MDYPLTKKQQKNNQKNLFEFRRAGKGARAILHNQILAKNKNIGNNQKNN